MREGAIAERVLPDGRTLNVYPLTFGRARIALSADAKTQLIDDSW